MNEFLMQFKHALESQTSMVVDIGDGESGECGIEFEGKHYDIQITETDD